MFAEDENFNMYTYTHTIITGSLIPQYFIILFFISISTPFRTSLSTEDCYQIGKQLNSLKLYREASEWLKEALKHYNEYYDLHQVDAIKILEELAISLSNNNEEHQANDIIGKILRMDSKNQIVLSILEGKGKRMRRSTTISDLCRPVAEEELLSLLTSTCPTYKI